MKILDVEKLEFETEFPPLDKISQKLDDLNPKIPVDRINWEEFTYKPDVRFSIAYTANEILLKYYVTEHWFKAEMTVSNQEVYEDSCVEFFISPGEDGLYYNFEFNAIGTCLMGTGKTRENRRRADPGIISGIRRLTSAGTEPVSEQEREFSWTITLGIPFKIFHLHKITDLKGKELRANFYKCGDKLSVPHFLTWNPVRAQKPDYHLPEFFGLLRFV